MAQNLLYIRDTLVRRYLSDTGKVTWQDTELDAYINDGGRYLLSEMLKVNSDYMLIRATASTVASQADYGVPSNMYSNKFRGLWVYSSSSGIRQEVKHRSSHFIMAMQHLSSIPQYYTTLRNIYVLGPVPDAVYTLELWYTGLPAPLTDDADECTFNDEEIDVIALWSAIRAKTARELDLGRLPELLVKAVDLVKSNIIQDDKLSVKFTPLDSP